MLDDDLELLSLLPVAGIAGLRARAINPGSLHARHLSGCGGSSQCFRGALPTKLHAQPLRSSLENGLSQKVIHSGLR